jgi:hypothetical protein
VADGLRVVAVDWSGRASGVKQHLWLAEAAVGDDGPELVRLECGRTREQLVDHLVDLLVVDLLDLGPLVVGLDFSFSLPEWWLREQGFGDGPGLWTAAAARGEDWLQRCKPPFWGRPGCPRPLAGEQFRATERALRVGGILPKSTFQVGGAGAVGTGSVRGWPHLARLRQAGYAVWPFDAPAAPPLVVEVWPRACTGAVVKSDPVARHAYVQHHLGHVRGAPRDLMCASEDAFDAACTALVMAEHATSFTCLAAPPGDDGAARREGWVWSPPRSSPTWSRSGVA